MSFSIKGFNKSQTIHHLPPGSSFLFFFSVRAIFFFVFLKGYLKIVMGSVLSTPPPVKFYKDEGRDFFECDWYPKFSEYKSV